MPDTRGQAEVSNFLKLMTLLDAPVLSHEPPQHCLVEGLFRAGEGSFASQWEFVRWLQQKGNFGCLIEAVCHVISTEKEEKGHGRVRGAHRGAVRWQLLNQLDSGRRLGL